MERIRDPRGATRAWLDCLDHLIDKLGPKATVVEARAYLERGDKTLEIVREPARWSRDIDSDLVAKGVGLLRGLRGDCIAYGVGFGQRVEHLPSWPRFKATKDKMTEDEWAEVVRITDGGA